MELVITLFVVGAILLVLETVLPGMIAGAIGLLCVVAGVVQSYVVFGPQVGTAVLFSTLVALVLGTMLWLKFFPRSPMGRAFASRSTVGDIKTERPELLHQTGTALTPLRPSGMAVINGRRVDVVTEGGMIERHTPIKVVAVEGLRVVVRSLSESTVEPKR